MNSTDSDSTENNRKDKDSHHVNNDDRDDNKRIRDAEFNNKNDKDRNKKLDSNNDDDEKRGRPLVDPHFKRLLWYLIGSTRGGINRAKILNFLKENPSNANQLSNQLKMDYKTIIHHLDVLNKNGLVIAENEESYGATYFISPLLEKNYSAFEEIGDKIGKK
ncbi:MAG: ArsR family transcriptional regulator [Candidatus Nitrosocosmicus sp.]|nr:ArsR family transcriptional regulator [Candidatus Nitrosocosmicus sp.]